MWCGSSVGTASAEGRTSAPASSYRVEAEEGVAVSEDEWGLASATGRTPLERLAYGSAVNFDRFLSWLSYVLVAHPKKMRTFMGALFIMSMVGGIVTRHPAHAQVLNSIETTVEGATGGWLANAIEVAKEIFMVLIGWTIMYNIVFYYMSFETVRGMFSVILRSLMHVAIPYLVLFVWAPTSVATVITWAVNISGDITNNTAPPVRPDAVVTEGVNIGWGLLQKSFNAVQQSHFQFNPLNAGNDLGYDATQMFVDVLFVLAAAILCVVMIAAFTFIAVELVMAFLNAYFVLPLGAWTLGFMGTPGTSNIGMSWWTALIQVSVRFIAILAAVSFAQNIGLQWQTDLAGVTTGWNQLPQGPPGGGAPPPVDIGALKTIISMALGACALLYLVMALPRLASSIISGAPVLTGMSAIQVAATPAMMGASAAMAAATGGASAGLQGAYMGAAMSMGKGTASQFGAMSAGAMRGFAQGAKASAGQGAQAGARAARNVNNSIDRMRGG